MVATDAPVSFAGRLRHLGPGIIVAGSIVGSGELVLTSSLGAVVASVFYGSYCSRAGRRRLYKANWHVCAFLTSPRFSRCSIVCQENYRADKKQVSWLVWYFFLNTFITLLAAGGILGGASEAIKLIFPEWSYPGIALTLTILAALILGSGSYQVLEKLLLLMVSSFTAISIYCAIALQFSDSAVPLTQILAAQSFDFPIKHLALIIAVFSFTGVNIGESIYYSYFCMDKGYANHIDETETVQGAARAKSWLRVMHTDVWLTLVLLTLVTIPFYILGASVLHTTGLEPDNNNMIQVISTIYTDVLGPWAKNLFLLVHFLSCIRHYWLGWRR